MNKAERLLSQLEKALGLEIRRLNAEEDDFALMIANSLHRLRNSLNLTESPALSCIKDGEEHLISEAQRSISESNWEVGRCAAEWMSRYSCGRSIEEFAFVVGLHSDLVTELVSVYREFMDIRKSFPRLLWAHFVLALDWTDDRMKCLKWANEVEAGVGEMRAWRQANCGEDVSFKSEAAPNKEAT